MERTTNMTDTQPPVALTEYRAQLREQELRREGARKVLEAIGWGWGCDPDTRNARCADTAERALPLPVKPLVRRVVHFSTGWNYRLNKAGDGMEARFDNYTDWYAHAAPLSEWRVLASLLDAPNDP